MTRLLAVLGAIFCIGMIFPIAATEQVRGNIDLQIVIINVLSKVLSVFSLLLYCGFAALHSVSRVENPADRVGWIILTLGLNVLGSLIYYLTKYQDFRAHGLGRIIRWKEAGYTFYHATPSELQTHENVDSNA